MKTIPATIPVTINLPTALIHDLRRIALGLDDAPGNLIRTVLLREVARHRSAKARNTDDEPNGARAHRALATETAAAKSWADMELRLARKGVSMTPAEDGFTLHDPHGGLICSVADLGYPHAALVGRFGAPLPCRAESLPQPKNEKVAGADPGDASDLVGRV